MTTFLTYDEVQAKLKLDAREVDALVAEGDLTPLFDPDEVAAVADKPADDKTAPTKAQLRTMTPQEVAKLPAAVVAKVLAGPKSKVTKGATQGIGAPSKSGAL